MRSASSSLAFVLRFPTGEAVAELLLASLLLLIEAAAAEGRRLRAGHHRKQGERRSDEQPARHAARECSRRSRGLQIRCGGACLRAPALLHGPGGRGWRCCRDERTCCGRWAACSTRGAWTSCLRARATASPSLQRRPGRPGAWAEPDDGMGRSPVPRVDAGWRRAAPPIASSMLHAALEARRRDDLYRVLGVPALAPRTHCAAARVASDPRGAGRRRSPGRARGVGSAARAGAPCGLRALVGAALGPLEPDQATATNGGGSGEPGVDAGERRLGRRRRREQRRRRRARAPRPSGTAASRARPSRSNVRAPARVAVSQVVPGDGDLDHALQRLPAVAALALPHRFEDLVHLEEESLVPQRSRAASTARATGSSADRGAPPADRGAQRARGVRPDRRVPTARARRAASVAPGVDQVDGREAAAASGGRRAARLRRATRARRARRRRRAPRRRASASALRSGRGKAGGVMRVDRSRARRLCYQPRCDRGSRLHRAGAGAPRRARRLRARASVGVPAPPGAGGHRRQRGRRLRRRLVRRGRRALAGPAHHLRRRPAGARRRRRCPVRTWVEDFRRVRSRRRYEVRARGRHAGAHRGDRLGVRRRRHGSAASRSAPEMETRFGVASRRRRARPGTRRPRPPRPAQHLHRVRWADLDALGHMNNAAYLDVLVQGALDVAGRRSGGRSSGLATAAWRSLRGAAATSSISTRSAHGDSLETAHLVRDDARRARRAPGGRPVSRRAARGAGERTAGAGRDAAHRRTRAAARPRRCAAHAARRPRRAAMDERPLADRVGVVTGASTGIGAATARALARAGMAVMLGARPDRRAGVGAVTTIRAAGGRAEVAAPTDVRDPAQVDALVDGAVARFGRLDAVVGNAAVGVLRPIAEGRIDEWRAVLETNLIGTHGALSRGAPAHAAAAAGRHPADGVGVGRGRVAVLRRLRRVEGGGAGSRADAARGGGARGRARDDDRHPQRRRAPTSPPASIPRCCRAAIQRWVELGMLNPRAPTITRGRRGARRRLPARATAARQRARSRHPLARELGPLPAGPLTRARLRTVGPASASRGPAGSAPASADAPRRAPSAASCASRLRHGRRGAGAPAPRGDGEVATVLLLLTVELGPDRLGAVAARLRARARRSRRAAAVASPAVARATCGARARRAR